MELAAPLIIAFASILLALALKPVAERLLLPYPLLLVITGYIVSEIVVALGFDTGIRAGNFQILSDYIFIPIILFASAFQLRPKILLQESLAIFSLAAVVSLVTMVIATIFIYFSIHHPTGFPWIAAIITAVLLSATNSRSIVDLLELLKVSERIIHLLESESLFTEVIAVVLFSLFLAMAQEPAQAHNAFFWIGHLLVDVFGGVIIGIVISILAIGLFKICRDSITQALISFAATYLAYLLAQDIFAVSGAIAVFCLGLIMGSKGRKYFARPNHFIDRLWNFNILFATAGIFLLVGVTITLDMFVYRYLAMLFGILAIILGRAIGIYGCFGLIKLSKSSKALSFREQTLLNWTGIRGSLTIALAFAIPVSLDYWWTIQSIAFGVVLFTLLIQASLTPLVVKWLRR